MGLHIKVFNNKKLNAGVYIRIKGKKHVVKVAQPKPFCATLTTATQGA
jgi:hypothetical protein